MGGGPETTASGAQNAAHSRVCSEQREGHTRRSKTCAIPTSPGLGMEGLVLLKWLVRHCAVADQAWAVRPLTTPLVPASELPVEVKEGGMGYAAPACRGRPRVCSPMAPLATRCSRGAKSPKPLLQAGLPRDGREPLRASPPQLHQGVEVGRLPCVVPWAQGPPSDQEKFPQTLHGTRPELLHTQLCPTPDP
jgi:hypothetical protein